MRRVKREALAGFRDLRLEGAYPCPGLDDDRQVPGFVLDDTIQSRDIDGDVVPLRHVADGHAGAAAPDDASFTCGVGVAQYPGESVDVPGAFDPRGCHAIDGVPVDRGLGVLFRRRVHWHSRNVFC